MSQASESSSLSDQASRTQTLVRTTLLLSVAVVMLYPLLLALLFAGRITVIHLLNNAFNSLFI